jgi:glycosyltransferase involved in cell wall biosynthesis
MSRSAGVSGSREFRPAKILIVNQVFWPDVSATAQYAHDLARHLVAQGHSVHAIASASLYGHVGAALPRREVHEGITIRRVGANVFRKRGIAGRLFDFLRFYVAAVWLSATLPRQDVVICLTTPPFIIFVGIVLRWLRGSRVVLWSMDLYPDVAIAANVIRAGSVAARLLGRLDQRLLQSCDRVVTLGRCMQSRLESRVRDPENLRCIELWSDPEEILLEESAQNPLRSEWGIGDRWTLMYSGNLGNAHDTRAILQAMDSLSSDDAIRWVIVGGGAGRFKIEAAVKHDAVRNVVLRGYQPRESVGRLLGLADVHLVAISQGFEGLLVPSKFYGVLAAGRPVVYIGPPGSEVERVIAEERCGLVVRPGDGAGLVSAIEALRNDPATGRAMGARGRSTLERRFSIQIGCGRWSMLIDELVCRQS